MPRRNTGPRLVSLRPRGYTEPYWFVRWYHAGARRERSTGIPDTGERSRPAAEAALESFLAERRVAGQRRAAVPLLSDILADYLEEHAPTVAAPARIAYAADRLLPWWGARTVADVRATTSRAYFRHRSAELALRRPRAAAASAPSAWGAGGLACFESTVRKELGVLNAALGHAAAERRIAPSYTPASLPPKGAARERWLTRPEAARLLRAACRKDWGEDWRTRQRGAFAPTARYERRHRGRHHVPLAILIGLYTGARPKAILRLQWQPNIAGGHVDLERGLIDFNPEGRDRRRTAKRYPIVPIPRRLLTFLHLARARATTTHVVEFEGRPVREIKGAFNRARDAAGLDAAVTPNTLRHTCASWLMQSGTVTIEQGARYIGDTPETFERNYWHHHPDYLKGARDALG